MTQEDTEEKFLKIAADVDRFEGYETDVRHAAGIAITADALSIKLGLGAHDRFLLRQAALLHDIGEMQMNCDYIGSSVALTDDERVDVRRHPVVGEQEAIRRGASRAVALFVRWHHEWWNGAGYPDAIRGEQIPLAARILRVADTFAAMTNERPYRAAVSAAEAKKYLTESAGIEFDPQIVKIFLSLEDV